MKKLVLSGVALGMMAGPALAGQPIVLTAAELDRVAAGNNTVGVTTVVDIANSNTSVNVNTAEAESEIEISVEAFDDTAILAALAAIQVSLDDLLDVDVDVDP